MKTKSKFFLLGTSAFLGLSVVACTQPENINTHSWSNNYSFDETNHWRNCMDCEAINFKSMHTFKDDKCIVCGYEKTNGGSGDDSGHTVPPTKDERWNLDFTKYGVEFRDALADLMYAKVTKTTTKDACLKIGKDAAQNGEGKFTPFYHGSDYAVSYSISSNREHTWPDSRGGGSKRGGDNVEKDPFMLRPTITSDNSNRENYFYGLNGKSNSEWDPATFGFEAGRGESARVIFYTATKYGKTNGLKLTNNPKDATSEKSMGTLKYLVEWNKTYPVTDMEIQINEYLSKQGYGRNPFVDHPEYVDYIWDKDGYVTSSPSGDSTSGGTSTGGGSTTGGGITTPTSYNLESSLANLDKNNFCIVNYNEKYTAMTSTNYVGKGDVIYTWYFNGADATVSNDLSTMKSSGATKFSFNLQTDGTYTIQAPDNKYLYSYVDGSHYSIGIAAENAVTNNGTIYWNISSLGKGFIFKGKDIDTYLQYNKSWCGKNTAPSNPLYLYK